MTARLTDTVVIVTRLRTTDTELIAESARTRP